MILLGVSTYDLILLAISEAMLLILLFYLTLNSQRKIENLELRISELEKYDMSKEVKTKVVGPSISTIRNNLNSLIGYIIILFNLFKKRAVNEWSREEIERYENTTNKIDDLIV